MISFTNQDIFLVTGASSGIGRAISCRIIELGGKVIGVGRNEEKLNQTKSLCSKAGNFEPIVKDLSFDLEILDAWIDDIAAQYGRLKGLVLSAGSQYTLPFKADKVQKAKELFDINFFCNIPLIKGFSKKINNFGVDCSIVVISSFTADLGLSGISVYSSSKAALNSYVRSLAVELAKSKIRINTVSPGHIITEMLSDSKSGIANSMIEKLSSRYPLGLGKPEYVANAVCFLLSPVSEWITGTNLIIDGGASVNFI